MKGFHSFYFEFISGIVCEEVTKIGVREYKGIVLF